MNNGKKIGKRKHVGLLSRIRGIDMFGKPVLLNINGEETVNTLWGSFMTVCCLVVLAAYIGIRFNILWSKANPNIIVRTMNNFFDHTQEFYFENNLQIAFGVVNFQSRKPLHDPNYVNWRAIFWEKGDDGIDRPTELKYHRCTEADFNSFFPI